RDTEGYCMWGSSSYVTPIYDLGFYGMKVLLKIDNVNQTVLEPKHHGFLQLQTDGLQHPDLNQEIDSKEPNLDIDKTDQIPEKFTVKNFVGIDKQYFTPIVNGMERVVNESGGTARRARLKNIVVCGKTGTAQNPHGEDHSIFIAFAPKDDPKIAIAVYVENAGFGGTWAAPIASLMMEQYLTDSISTKNIRKEKRILEANLLNVKAKK
ncbi:MAG: hypothetical protein HRT73_15710, partial [Flavobacteriales bacterium]|nr:hypothetical protein [Flavobacteriales bacterium]